jgi:hypothetical protein
MENFTFCPAVQDRGSKERAICRRRLKRLWQRLRELQIQDLTRDKLLLKLGAAQAEARRACRLVEVRVPRGGAAGLLSNFELYLAQAQTSADSAERRSLSVALESGRGRSGLVVAAPCSAQRGGSSRLRSEERLDESAPFITKFRRTPASRRIFLSRSWRTVPTSRCGSGCWLGHPD